MSKIESFRCPVCESVGQWQNVDAYRLKPAEMHICTSCGFVSFPTKYKTEDEIKSFYKNEYRNIPRFDNIVTGSRKLNYHHYFLNPIFEEWKKIGIKPVIGEIGSAFGMFLDWARGHFPDGEFVGTEITSGFKKIAKHYYGLDLKDDFDYSKKYDLICSYHVLEHQLDPDIKLKEYAACLKDHGFMYVSCPVWFRDMNVAATAQFDIEYYWHPDHINAWHEKHLEHIFAKAGLEVLFKDDSVYGNTYILKKAKEPLDLTVPKLFDECFQFVQNAFKVFNLLFDHKAQEAIAVYKNVPSAWIMYYEFNRAVFDKDREGLMKFIKDAIANCPNSSESLAFAADVMQRYDRFDEAIDYLTKALKKRPNSASLLLPMASCYRSKAIKEIDPELKKEFLNQSISVLKFVAENAPEAKSQAVTWMFHDMSYLD